ncbi:MAG: methyltransferase domain-containing protein, partial [Proteobacteria bacterium]|nr:methyltransferase domain-containing protein [Pseudomonadota bacterium]
VDVTASFSGSIPEYYDSCLGPAWLDAFAVDLAQRLPAKPPGDVLEIACGTGQVTRRARERLDPAVRLVATDLSKSMLDYARAKLSDCKGIEWREADAVNLPFGDGEFGAVVCAFGVMFMPDRRAAFSEAHRVLKEGGIVLFNVWDRIEENPHSAALAEVFERLFPGDEEMRFTTPFEMHDPALLRKLLAEAHFGEVKIEKKWLQLDRVSARTLAVGQIRGTPRSLLLEKRGISLDEVVEKATAALTKLGGADPYRGPAQAVVVEARRRARG